MILAGMRWKLSAIMKGFNRASFTDGASMRKLEAWTFIVADSYKSYQIGVRVEGYHDSLVRTIVWDPICPKS